MRNTSTCSPVLKRPCAIRPHSDIHLSCIPLVNFHRADSVNLPDNEPFTTPSIPLWGFMSPQKRISIKELALIERELEHKPDINRNKRINLFRPGNPMVKDFVWRKNEEFDNTSVESESE